MWSCSVLLGLTLLVFGKTAQGQSYTGECYLVVDDSAVQNYVREIRTAETYAEKYVKAVANLRKDVDYMITMVNNHYSSLSQYGLYIDIRIRRLDILSSNIIRSFLPGTLNVVDSIVARNAFQNWLAIQDAYNVVQYDFALHWTGFDLYGSSGLGENSITNMGTVCASNALSVVEMMSTFRDVRTTAHAIAAILGANTDGVASTNVMAVLQIPSDANRWTFSACTANSIKDFAKLARSSCLLRTSSVSTKPSVTYSTYNGSILDPNVICQRNLNDSRSYMCMSLPQVYNNQPPRGNAVCGQIYCRIPNTMTCTPAYTSDGMVCDSQKRCTSGQCSSYQTPTTTVSNCVWGDQKTLEFPSIAFYGSCQAYISRYGAATCYTSPINESCCSTCKQYNSGRVGCEYGDQSNQCTLYTKASVCPQYKNSLCCGYCYGFVGKREVFGDAPQLNQTVNNVGKTDTQPYEITINTAR